MEDFAGFCRELRLDSGEPLVLEPFQRTMLADFFAGTRETLILLPKKQGKTTLLSALALFHLSTTEDAECVIAAASRDQASIMLRQASGFIRRSEALQTRLSVKAREIEHRTLGGRVRVLASDVDTADGVIPTLALVDELHRFKDSELYGVFRDGLGPRGGRMVTISTAGWDRESTLWKLRQKALELGAHRDGSYLHTRSPDGGFALHEWSLVEGIDDVDDLDAVKRANPLSTTTVELLRERHDSPSTTSWQWQRFACNLWTAAEASWLPPGAWEALGDPNAEIPDGAAVWLGIDVGLKRDSSAVVAVHRRGDDRCVVNARVLDPPAGGALDILAVESAVREAAHRWQVLGAAFDPMMFVHSAAVLGDEGIFMIEYPQGSRMVAGSAQLYEAIVGGLLVHAGDPVLASHVAAGVTTDTDRGWRLTKRRARDKIDALIALVMAYDVARREPKAPRMQSKVPISFNY